jgi:16S rRNA (uracil1498-N3)-methyltransferase
VDGGRSSGIATFFCDAPLEAGHMAELGDSEAHHARVRRLEPGVPVRLLDGAGTVADGALAKLTRSGAMVEVNAVSHTPPPAPVHLLVPIADRDRMLWLAEKATELGLTSWRAVMWHRSRGVAPRGEGEAFRAKVRARMVSALTQSAGAWLPTLLPDIAVEDVALTTTPGSHLLLDSAGDPMLGVSISAPLTLAVGPEGGFEHEERQRLVLAGWIPVSLGSATLRFETAGVAALAIARVVLAANVENARG